MAGSTFGKNFTISTWGESHGKAVGVCIDGCPAGIFINEEIIQKELDKRRPGQSEFSTQRAETDKCKILSGVFEGMTTGTPILIMVENSDQRSKDYKNIADVYRPGHADFTFDKKYGVRDYRGGGRSSGRETIGRVAAGAVAGEVLGQLNIKAISYVSKIGDIEVDMASFDEDEIYNNPLRMPDGEAAKLAAEYVNGLIKDRDSAGGIVECRVNGLKAGFGEPVFDKLDARIAHAVMSVGAVKGVELGAGFAAAALSGSKNNDEFYARGGAVGKKTNKSGGVLGGISDGSELIVRAAIKPTPSIARLQNTVDRAGEERQIEIAGRHDPLIAARAVPVIESMVKIVVLDEIMEGMHSQIKYIKDFYENV